MERRCRGLEGRAKTQGKVDQRLGSNYVGLKRLAWSGWALVDDPGGEDLGGSTGGESALKERLAVNNTAESAQYFIMERYSTTTSLIRNVSRVVLELVP